MRKGSRVHRGALAAVRAPACTFAAVALALSSAPNPAYAYTARPSATVGYYESERLPDIVEGLDVGGFPARAPVYFGNYSAQPRHGVSSLDTTPPHAEVAGERYRYAPILQIHESTLWDRRRVSEAEAETLAAADQDEPAGSMPSMPGVLRSSSRTRLRWGTELGRRFRDRFRERIARGEVDAWQFDEILTEVAGRNGVAYREFTRGILYGLQEGRPRLGDKPIRGLVHVAHPAFAAASKRATSELRRFWRRINLASVRLIGEEYPFFRGRASAAASEQAVGQRALARIGGDRAALSRRYIVGMTPGYIVTRSLGGNLDSRSRDWVNRWRADYVRARAAMGVAGFGEYNLTGKNNRGEVIRDVTRALAVGVRRLQ